MIGRQARGPRYTHLRQGHFEVRKSGIVRLGLKDPYHLAVALPWPAFIVCGVAGLIAVNALFALLYGVKQNAVHNLVKGDYLHAFFFSLETITTVGYGEMYPGSLYGYTIAGVEMVVGMAFVALLTGILFARFSRSQAGILFADTAVVATHRGIPTLMIRVGNGRSNMLTSATARLSILLREVNDEGQVFRRYHEVSLVSPNLPAFPLTWTLMHTIDEASPLYMFGPMELRAAWGSLFLAVEATDGKLGRQVLDVADYDDSHILFGWCYVDAVVYDEHGVPTADMSKLSHVTEARHALPN